VRDGPIYSKKEDLEEAENIFGKLGYRPTFQSDNVTHYFELFEKKDLLEKLLNEHE
jgi:hypothetical protein